MDCATYALILVGLGVLFLPSVVLGQVQTPKIQIHTDVENPKALLNLHLQALGESEQEVVSHRLMLSEEQSEENPPSEAVGMSRGEPSGRAFFSHPFSSLIPLQDSSTDNSGPSTNAGESVGDRLRDLQQAPGDAQISLAILDGNSKTFAIKLGDQPSGGVVVTITGYDGHHLEVSPTQLMFDDSNWNVEQTVTVNVKQQSDNNEVELIFEASGGGIKESTSIDVRILDTSPVTVNLSAEPSEIPKGERLTFAVTPLRPFARLITGEVPLKFGKDMSEEDGKSYNTVPKIPIPRDVKSAVTEIQIGEGTDQNNEMFMVTSDGNLLPPGIELGSPSSVEGAINDGDGSPHICLEMSPNSVVAGRWVTIKATIISAQSRDIEVLIHFRNMVNIFDPASIIFDNPGRKEKTVTIPAGERESESFKFKTRWSGPLYDYGYPIGKPNVEYRHRACLCPRIHVLPPPRLLASPNPVEEGQPVTITVSITEAQSSDVTVSLNYPNAQTTDTAIDPDDYTSLTSITIKANTTQGSGVIQTHEDVIKEDDETFTVAIGETLLPSGIVLTIPSSVEVTINDNDTPRVRFDSSTGIVDEDVGTHNVAVSISPAPGADLTVNYTLGGTATRGTDYISSGTVSVAANATSVNIPVVITDDDVDENDETLTLTLTSGTGYNLGTPKTHTLTITDNDLIEVSFASATSNSLEEGTHNVRVNINPAFGSALTLNYTLSGTATENTDYSISGSGTVSVAANATSVNIPVVITDDNVDEDDETVILTLANGAGYTVGTPKIHMLTITDNDLIEVSFASATSSASEKSTHNVRVNINPAFGAALTLNYTLSGTATENTDYSISGSGTVSVAANATSVNIPIVITDDNVDDHAETIILTLASGAGYTVGSPSEHTLTLTDLPKIRFHSSGFSVPENQNWWYVRVAIHPAPESDITVNYQLGGTATEDADYEIGRLISYKRMTTHPIQPTAGHKNGDSRTFSVPAFSQEVFIQIKINDDTVNENSETIILTMESGTGYTVGSPNEYTVAIMDNDTPAVRFASATDSVDEGGGTHNVSVNIDPAPGSDLTLSYTLGGTAATEDYRIQNSGTVSVSAGATSVSIPVEIIDDDAAEDAETIILTLESGTGYTVGSPSEHILTITDNETPQVNFASAAGSVGEDGGTRDVEVSLSPAPGADLTLSYTLGGTATETADYSITGSGMISVAANATSVKIPVVITDDNVDDDAETIILTLTSGTGYRVGSANVHTLTITDNDTPQVNFASAAGSVGEDGGTRDVEVSLSPAPGAALTLSYTLGGTATETADYSITGSGTISVSAGATSVNIPIVITDDIEEEPDDTIILTLTDGTEYTVGSANVHTLTITDNDTPQVSFASSSSRAPEKKGTHHVAVRINPAPAAPFTLSYGTGGTATRNTDYTSSGTISVANWSDLGKYPDRDYRGHRGRV